MARNEKNEDKQALMVVPPPRLPMPGEARTLGFDEGQWQALIDTTFPSARSVGGVMLAINYCRSRKLDIFKRPVHVVPVWNTALGREVESVWPGIGEYRTTASRTGLWAGNDECVFGPTKNEAFKDKRTRKARKEGERDYVLNKECAAFDFPEWAQITVYKMVQGQRVAFIGPKVLFKETYSGQAGLNVPNERWQKAPFQMLEKCAEAAALRRAFPDELGDSWTAEEMEGKAIDGGDLSTFADPGEQQEEEPTPSRPTRNKPEPEIDAEEQAKIDWWQPGGIEEFFVYAQEHLGKAKSNAVVKRFLALDYVKEAIEHLPADNTERWRSLLGATYARVAPKTETNAEAPTDDGAAGEGDGPSDAERFARYLFDLEGFCGSTKTPIDVNSLKARERQSIAQLPADLQKTANLMLDTAMAAAKEGVPFADKWNSGDAAPEAASPEDQQSQEEKS